MRFLLGSFLFLFSSVSFAQVEFDHIEFQEKGTIAPNGVEYCLTALHANELRLEGYFDYLPCEMVRTVLSEYDYSHLPRQSYGYFKDLIVLGSDQLKVKGDFFDFMNEEFTRFSGKKKWVSVLNSYTPVISAFAEVQIPKMNNKFGNLTNWSFNNSFNKIPALLKAIVDDLNAKTEGDEYVLRQALDSEISVRVRCASQFYHLSRGGKSVVMGVCSASEPFFSAR